MSNNNSTDVLAWVANVRAMEEELSRPLEGTSDPRYIALVEKFGAENVASFSQYPETADLGSNYFRYCGGALLPAPTIDRPEWAKSHTLYLDEMPDAIGVEFEGQKWETYSGNPDADGPEASAQLSVTYYIAMQDFDDDGQHRSAGDVWLSAEPNIEFTYMEPRAPGVPPTAHQADLTLDGARALEIALGDVLNAARELV
jgi:hypothetical protein